MFFMVLGGEEVMKNPNRSGLAGTLESCDILVTVALAEAGTGIAVDLTSPVEVQFGDQIRAVIREVLAELRISDALVSATDRGALDCTIRARTEAAVGRALKEEVINA
jgi:citrate lyase subunit gamma (acyl carrier protein)